MKFLTSAATSATSKRSTTILALLLFVSLGCFSCGKAATPAAPAVNTDSATPSATPVAAATPMDQTAAKVAVLKVHQETNGHRAVILGTTAEGGSAFLPLSDKENKVKVDVMWVRHGKPAVGGSSPTWLTGAPSADDEVRVGVFEQFSGGMGAQSRSSVWIAAFLAATTLGHDLTNFRFSAEVGGFVDGPSAGGLFTAGFLAALTGTAIDPDATMTGTINPDGTIGPVGGIPQKFEASIAKGKKRLGYPVGSRYSTDMNTGRNVDLRKLAEASGVEAREIRDIYDAYELMTGKKMPRPVPLPVSEMEVDSTVNDMMRANFAEWRKLMTQNFGQIVALARAGKLPAELAKLALTGQKEAKAADRSLSEGLFPTAYFRNMEATVYAVAAVTIWKIVAKVQAGDIDGATKLLGQQVNTVNDTVAAMKQIGTEKPTSIGGHLMMISAFQKATAAIGFAVWGMREVKPTLATMAKLKGQSPAVLSSRATAESLSRLLAPVVLNMTRGQAMAVAAVQGIKIESTQSIDYSCSEPAARQLAKSYSSAAIANLRYFESMLVKMIVDAKKIPEAQAKKFLGLIEPDYVTTTMAMQMSLGNVPFMAKLKTEWGEESLAWSLQSLGSSIMTYFRSSLLISRWYSLGVKKDRTTGKAVQVAHEKAFINMIESAERSARAHAHSAKVAIGKVPIQSRIAYQRARVLREGDLDDKLKALEAFWASSSYSQTAVVMARYVINPAKHGKFGK